MSEPDSRGKDGLFEEAAGWFARMRGPDADASRADFEKWLARGALHRAAYNRAAEVFAMGKLLADEHHDALVTSSQLKPLNWRVVIGGVAAALLAVMTAALLLMRVNTRDVRVAGSSFESPAERPQLAELSASGGAQSIRLVDNSLVRLESGARLSVQYANSERRLSLERGSARFVVAHEPRPFIVYAGGGFVIAHGTIFDVGLTRASRVIVRLIEGVVDVNAPIGNGKDVRPSSAHRRLHAGEMVSFVAAAIPVADKSGDKDGSNSVASPAALTAGTDEFDAVTLGDLIHLANERNATAIRFASPATAERRISGKFRIDNADLLAQRIAGLFDLAVDRSEPGQIVLRAR